MTKEIKKNIINNISKLLAHRSFHGLTFIVKTFLLKKLKLFNFLIFKMIKMISINKINEFKQKFHNYFLMKNSLQALSNAMKNYYIISVGFNEIYNGIKKPKKFKMCILVCLINWITTFYHLIWISSDYFWSKTDGPFLPNKSRICYLGAVVLFFYIGIFKTDLALSEINSNLSPFKVFYPLMKDVEAIHKLTD